MKKFWLRFVSWFNRKAKNLAIRLVKWTGKSKEYVHPKHLIAEGFHFWFTPYLKSDDIILDLGCGGGAHTIVAAKVVNCVVGIDHNARNLAIAKRLIENTQLRNVSFREAALEQPLPEPNEAFTGILALDVLEHLVARDQLLKETRRLLKPGGQLFLSVPNRSTSWKKKLQQENLFYYSDLDHKHEYEAGEIREILEQHGYRILHFDPTVYDTPWVGMIDVLGGVSLLLYRQLSKWKHRKTLEEPGEATGFRIVARKVS